MLHAIKLQYWSNFVFRAAFLQSMIIRAAVERRWRLGIGYGVFELAEAAF
jgi:hypothetical protein